MFRKALSLVFAAIAFLAFAGTAHAQLRATTVEISPFYGWFFGGSFPNGSNALFSEKVDLDDTDTFGVRIGYNMTQMSEFELQWSHVDTHFISHDSGEIFGPDGSRLGDLKVDYFLGYYTMNFGHSRFVPYVSIGGGAARLDPSVPDQSASSSTRFTGSLGGGMKLFITPNFGLRFDGRFYSTYLNDSCDHHNDHDHCDNSHYLTNGDVTGGLVFAF